MNPPRGHDAAKVLAAAEQLRYHGVDVVNIPDGPRASARMSALHIASLIQQWVGMETVLHYTCRDRNLLGLQADLLGAHALGLRNILAVTGDPPKLGDYPTRPRSTTSTRSGWSGSSSASTAASTSRPPRSASRPAS